MTASGLTEGVFGFLIWNIKAGVFFRSLLALLPSLVADLFVLIFSTIIIAQLVEHLSDKELIKQCVGLSEKRNQLWKEFQKRFDQPILVFIINELGKHWNASYLQEFKEAVQDIRQDVYAKLLKDDGKALKEFKGLHPESFRAYLRAIAINLAKNFSKNETKQRKRVTESISTTDKIGGNDIDPGCVNTEDDLEEEFVKEHLVQTLRVNYPGYNIDRDIMVFKLYFFEGLSSSEIAKSFKPGISVSGIETVISRMKKILEKAYFGR
ncbi:MAG TPA: sigma-70 family RNA polymerase sigma factor [bacterium]